MVTLSTKKCIMFSLLLLLLIFIVACDSAVEKESELGLHAGEKDLFAGWLRHVVNHDSTGELRKVFLNDSIPVGTVTQQLADRFNYPDSSEGEAVPSRSIPAAPMIEAENLFRHLAFPLDPRCTGDRSKWWYRTIDGSCNWLKANEISIGQVGTAKSRDYNQVSFKDRVSEPRDGPNARAVSNAFFRRKKTIHYEHTPLLLGLVEVSYLRVSLLSANSLRIVYYARCVLQSRLVRGYRNTNAARRTRISA
jgi:hypothetical protein